MIAFNSFKCQYLVDDVYKFQGIFKAFALILEVKATLQIASVRRGVNFVI